MRSTMAGVLLTAILAVTASSAPAAAQTGVSASDIQRLQDNVAALNGEFT